MIIGSAQLAAGPDPSSQTPTTSPSRYDHCSNNFHKGRCQGLFRDREVEGIKYYRGADWYKFIALPGG